MDKNESDNLPFNIDLGCPLFIQTPAIAERLPTFLIGIVPQSGLILKTPSVHNADSDFFTGMDIILRYVFMGEAFGFRSKVLNTITNPFKLMFISYPEKIETMCLRKQKRVLCNIPALLIHSNSETKGVVVDLSCHGVLFSSKVFCDEIPFGLGINKAIELVMPLMGIEGMTMFEGVVKNIRQDEKGLHLGIAFENMPDDLHQKLEKYVKTIMEYI